jgi:hypothetical protein
MTKLTAIGNSVFSRILLGCGFILPLIAMGQSVEKWNTYAISHKINQSNLNSKRLFRDKTKAGSLENNIANFYLYKNGVLVKPTSKSGRDFYAAGCLCFKFNDTLLFSSGLGRSAGVGLGLKIIKDQFSSTFHVNSGNALVYKLNKDDSDYVDDLNVEPLYQSLKLMQKPNESGEIMVGEYHGIFRNFYQKGTKTGRIYIRKYSVTLIFKCKITGIDSIKN